MAQFQVIKQIIAVIDMPGVETVEEAARELRKSQPFSSHISVDNVVGESITSVELVGDSEVA